jgi:uncharacterized membrane protein
MAFGSAPRWLLPASLSVNVFLVVMIVVLRMPHHFWPPPREPGRMVEEIAASLPPADGAILREVFQRHAPQVDSAHVGMRSFHDAIQAALSAPTFDPEALRAVFAEGRKRRMSMDDALEASLIETASKISYAGRKKLGEWTPPGPPGPPPPR